MSPRPALSPEGRAPERSPPERPSGPPGRGPSPAGAGAGRLGVSVGAAEAAGRAGSSLSSGRRGGRGGSSLPDDVTRRPGGPGGRGEPIGGRGGPGGGEDGRGGADRAGRLPGGGAVGRGGAWPPRAAAGWPAPAGGREAPPEGRSGAERAAAGWAASPRPAPALRSDAFDDGTGAAADSAAAGAAAPDSSGCSARTMPSRRARRRTRSACASSMPDECVLTPIPSLRLRSRHSLFVSPSSLASSWTLIFAAKLLVTSPSSFGGRGACTVRCGSRALHCRAPHPSGTNAADAQRRQSPSAVVDADLRHAALGGTHCVSRPTTGTSRACLCTATLRAPEVYGPRPAFPRHRP
jgi:hypothetical protein